MSELYHHCIMCQTVEVQGIRMSIDTYHKAGGNDQDLTSGVCNEHDCKSALILYCSNGDEGLANILKKEMEEEH